MDRLPWGPVVRDALLETMRSAKSDSNAYDKATEFLQLLCDAFGNKSNYIYRQNAVKIVADREFVVALWQGVTSRQIQFRMLRSFLSKRETLLQLGADEEDLPLSPELAEAKEAARTTESEPAKSDADAAEDSGPSFPDDVESLE
jgi:hypothetical protein